MDRLIYEGPGKLRWQDGAEPEIASPTGAVVRPIASTTCDLDRAIVAGVTPFAAPFAIGHEAVAEVVAVGEGVDRLGAGDLVVVPWHICCTACRRCRAGMPADCERFPRHAMYGLPLGGDFGGLFDELVAVPYADALVPLPAGLDPVKVASASDNLTDAYRAVEPHLRSRSDARVLVLGGTGSIGVYAVAWSRVLGAAEIAFFDPRHADDGLAEDYGAIVLSDLPDDDADGFDVVVDACAHAPTLARGLERLAPGGHCHSVGIYFEPTTPMPLARGYMTGITFSTGRPQVLPSIPSVLKHIAAGAFDPEPIFSDRLPTEDAADALGRGLRKPVFIRTPSSWPAGGPTDVY